VELLGEGRKLLFRCKVLMNYGLNMRIYISIQIQEREFQSSQSLSHWLHLSGEFLLRPLFQAHWSRGSRMLEINHINDISWDVMI
jgi:hypothetical protein